MGPFKFLHQNWFQPLEKKNVTNMSIMWEQKKHIIHMAHMMILIIIIS